MAEMKDVSSAGDKFSVVARKHRAALTPEERKLMALKHIADQAVLVLNKHKQVVAAQTERLLQFEESAAAAAREFEAAKAAMEAK